MHRYKLHYKILISSSSCRPGFQWSHEQASEMMLEYLVDDNNIDIERDHLNLIKDLIAGAPRSQRYWSMAWSLMLHLYAYHSYAFL